jgi:hypothetical protein
VGLFGKDKKQDQGSDWVQPAQLLSQLGQPGGSPGGAPRQGGQPVPVRLRSLTGAGPAGDWLPGALHLATGSISWQPDGGVSAEPVELATATILPPSSVQPRKGRGMPAMITEVETQAGRFQLDMDPVLFDMSQELVNGGGGGPSWPGWPGGPAGSGGTPQPGPPV